MPDLDAFVGFVEDSFREIRRAAGIGPGQPTREEPRPGGEREPDRPASGAGARA
jgi:hypothetical protein